MFRFLMALIFTSCSFIVYGGTDCACEQLNGSTISYTTLMSSKNAVCKAAGLERFAQELVQQKKWNEAEEALRTAQQLLEEKSCSNERLLPILKLLDNIYITRGNYEEALQVELRILPILENRKDSSGVPRALLNIANIFFTIKQWNKGIDYTRQSLPHINRLHASTEQTVLLTRAAQRYFTYYEQVKDKKFLDTMSMIVHRAKQIMESIPFDKKTQFLVYTRLATIAIEQRAFDKAIEYIDHNLIQCDRAKDIAELAVNFSDKAEVMYALQRYPEAMRWADSSLLYNKKIGSPSHLANLYHLLSEIAEKNNDPQKALMALQEEKKLTDSINDATKVAAIQELEKKYNQAKNEQKIHQLAQEKTILILLVLAALFAVLLIGFFLRQQSLKHKQVVLLTEQRLNRARMNPHFFFNTLAALQHVALQNNSGMMVAGQLAKFSFIMRESLESTYKEFISLEEEINFLHHFLTLQKVRFEQPYQYQISCDEQLDTSDTAIPPMILQPFIENSIEHGFHQLDYTGEINIHFSSEASFLVVHLTDNGKGLGNKQEEKETHISRATQIIRDRIYLLNLKFKSKASFQIADNTINGKGVAVKIYLPLLSMSHLNTNA